MQNKTILFADDSATMCTIMEKTFLKEPYDVVTVPSGQAAITKIRESTPDIVFLDSGMAGVSGYDVCRIIRNELSMDDLPVIIMSGVSDPYDESKGNNAQATENLKKPFDTANIIELVNDLTESEKAVQKKPPAAPPKPPDSKAVQPVKPPFPPKAAGAPPPPRPPESGAPEESGKTHKETMEFIAHSKSSPPPEPLTVRKTEDDSKEDVEKDVEPLEINVREETDEAAIQIGTLAELAQMTNEGEPVHMEEHEDAIPLPPQKDTETADIEEIEDEEIEDDIPAPDMATAIREKTRQATKEIQAKTSISSDQLKVLESLSAEIIEQIVWEVVPDLAETIIKEQLAALLKE